ncbi:DUF480 domain-containing protein [Tuwongella immobilis]|uniref:Uncharacterized protein n=1 Tax=Tuwongella immobilis TaxID=692036 RepID=A0A6C2YV69_9BACT|nr:DUF480 domain-containing protein [Tuwongella immobilis]VIP05638.1 Uncharacterized protein OS=Isosphaera pallida (strain ATCC 43644 / DSM 9630 / IS1B) GN=Isop_2889 PE=4 SV=1: DUF480 [Tuwongella immobilis]VTS08632.1 Uncharacterized protein OS=Isosphaera pallida (strain ATCC 43644 / DSM 9630 / IS1B) GN=Isop_2889 PE=4 SV=1: DUF480 [Tuwongella immobilis]
MSESITIAPLQPYERRVLGVLVEKALTTPESYPLTLNALVNGCNQKSNRDPVTDLADDEVEDVLPALQKRLEVIKLSGSSRVEKYRHDLYECWKVNQTELAILAELLLRGPQTEGELRGRASRMLKDGIADLDQLRDALRPLVNRGLVVYLTPEGRRGTILTHGLYPPAEMAGLKAKFAGGIPAETASPSPSRSCGSGSASAPPPSPSSGPSIAEQIRQALAPLQDELAASRDRIAQLEQQLARVQRDLTALQQSLGISPGM